MLVSLIGFTLNVLFVCFVVWAFMRCIKKHDHEKTPTKKP